MKKSIKIISLILIALIFATCICTISNADYSGEMKTLINKDYSDSSGVSGKAQSIANPIIVTVRIVAVATAIVILLVIAMKYMFAAPGDKADIKKSAVPYVIGAVVVFGAVGILQLISTFSGMIK